jgi:uncharacterized protein with GYD domain
MPKYLVKASLSVEALKGTLKDGGTKRRAVVTRLAETLGGRLEAFYYAFGDNDLYVIIEAPDNISAAAASLTVSAAGVGQLNTVVLITPEEMDEVAKRHAEYTPPGA